jgi:hypothetical protein
MHARMTFVTLKPDKIDEGVKVYRDFVLPNIKNRKVLKMGSF